MCWGCGGVVYLLCHTTNRQFSYCHTLPGSHHLRAEWASFSVRAEQKELLCTNLSSSFLLKKHLMLLSWTLHQASLAYRGSKYKMCVSAGPDAADWSDRLVRLAQMVVVFSWCSTCSNNSDWTLIKFLCWRVFVPAGPNPPWCSC